MIEEKKEGKMATVGRRMLLELAAAILLVVLWGQTVWAYSVLPESIPVHFNFKGEVDRYGSKTNLFILSIIATIIYLGLTFIPAKLAQFNFPNSTDKENRSAQINFARSIFMYLKIVILVIFLILSLFTCLVSLKMVKGLGLWFYLLLMILFVPTIVIVIKAIKIKRH